MPYCFGLKTFSLIENIVYSLTVRSLTTVLSSVAFPKAQTLAQYDSIYVNDLLLIIVKRIKTKLFAGDAKIYDEIISISDCLCIQESLNLVSDRSDFWQLTLKIPKCIAIQLKKNNSQFAFRMKGVPIPSENTISDLGFIVSKDLTYHE